MKLSQLSGPEIKIDDNHPATLREYIHNISRHWPEGMLLETHSPTHVIKTTYKEIYLNSLKICGQLQAKKISRSNPVILFLDTAHQYTAAVWACILSGYVLIPWSLSGLNKNNKKYQEVLEALFRQLSSACILTSSSVINRLGDIDIKVSPSRILMIDDMLNHSSATAANEPFDDGESIGCMISTSGTTGSPKLVCISNNTMYFRKTNAFSLAIDRPKLNSFPLNSITGMNIAFPSSSVSHYFNTSLIASQPLYLLDYIQNNKVQAINLNSYMAALLCKSIELSKPQIDLSCLKSLSFGADYIILKLVKNLVRHFNDLNATNIKISFGYGMTESSIICHKKFQQQQLFNSTNPEQLPFLSEVTKGMSVRIADENSTIIPQGEVGQIQLHSDKLLFSSYFNNPELTEGSFTSDGWFNTGDRGVIHNDQLKITGRTTDKTIAEFDHKSAQEIENAFHDLHGLYNSMLYICPVRLPDSTAHEMVIFFVPKQTEKDYIQRLAESIQNRKSETITAKLRALVPVSINDIEVTATGKISRKDLLTRYLRSEFQALELNKTKSNVIEETSDEGYLIELCKSVLKLEFAPETNKNLFQMGADSLSIVQIVDEIEQKFQIKIPALEFYNNPTINSLSGLISKSSSSTLQSAKNAKTTNAGNVLDLPNILSNFVATWGGTRLFNDSLLTGLNLTGNKEPIFWVCQGGNEFKQLAKHAGKNQPVYCMRSLVNTPFDYSQDVVEMIASRYLWEIMALDIKHPIVLGGNCQAAIISLAMARMLQKANRAPKKLILLEWSFNRKKYDGNVLLIYGKYSNHTADIYHGENKKGINWKNDFPHHSMASIPCAHGQFFKNPNIQILVKTIQEHLHDQPIKTNYFSTRLRKLARS